MNCLIYWFFWRLCEFHELPVKQFIVMSVCMTERERETERKELNGEDRVGNSLQMETSVLQSVSQFTTLFTLSLFHVTMSYFVDQKNVHYSLSFLILSLISSMYFLHSKHYFRHYFNITVIFLRIETSLMIIIYNFKSRIKEVTHGVLKSMQMKRMPIELI